MFLIVAGVLGLFVGIDAYRRRDQWLLWGFGTFILAVVVMPLWYAKRPLMAGERREGGTGWNFLKNFAILWTIVMLIVTAWSTVGMGSVAASAKSDAEMAGAGLGMIFGYGMLGAFWFFPVLGSLVLGLLIKKSSIVEIGPTTA
jgi:hypothetical protein